MLNEGISADESEISFREMPETPILLGEPTNFSGGEGVYGEFLAFCSKPRDQGLNLSYPIGGFSAVWKRS
ncbi:MAG: hypothetical protein LBU32_04140 [Clostridiales bacterium]|nr:hypothetical protein [Clostridiales bacterium]